MLLSGKSHQLEVNEPDVHNVTCFRKVDSDNSSCSKVVNEVDSDEQMVNNEASTEVMNDDDLDDSTSCNINTINVDSSIVLPSATTSCLSRAFSYCSRCIENIV